MSRAPAHAGSLRLTERFAFVMMFTVMAAFVVGLSILAAKTRADTGLPVMVGSGRTEHAVQGAVENPGTRKPASAAKARAWSAQPSEVLSARLSAALRTALGTRAARLSVGVIDATTGAEALYRATEHYRAGPIAGVDILAALLYKHQLARTQISRKDAGLAAEMIKNGSRTGAATLWRAIGEGDGLAVANRALGLRHTVPGAPDDWGITRTTAADQLQLLADLAASRSALNSAGRAYELGLMARSAAARRWGLPAAARRYGEPASGSLGTSYSVIRGWQGNPRRFAVNSIGVIDRAGHQLLVVILSRNWPTAAAGVSEVQAATAAAVGAMSTSS